MNKLKKVLKNKHFALIGTGLLQVTLVALNTYQVSHRYWFGAMLVGFLISFVWSFNVKKIAFGTLQDRILYSLGASLGTGLGMLIGTMLYEI